MEKIAMKWLGNGFYVNIPARDLTAEEVKRYGGREFLLTLGIYAEIEPPKPKKAKEIVIEPLEADIEEDESWQE